MQREDEVGEEGWVLAQKGRRRRNKAKGGSTATATATSERTDAQPSHPRQQRKRKDKGKAEKAAKANGNTDGPPPVVEDGTQMYSVVRAGKPRPLLILLDLNGTLIFRSPNVIKDALERPHLKALKRHYYYRPYAREFVHWLAAHDNAVVAFYTSMTAYYAVPAREWLVQGLDASIIPAMYEQEWNQRDETTQFRFKRDLPRLWVEINRRLRNAFPDTEIEFNESNTMTIDDSAWKMRAHPDNVIAIPEYEAPCVSRHARQAVAFPVAELFGESRQPSRTQDDDGMHIEAAVLPCVQTELERLLQRWTIEHDHVGPLVKEMQANLNVLFPQLPAAEPN